MPAKFRRQTGGPAVPRRSGSGGGAARPRGRNLRVRVKTARGRKASSTRWLSRQLNDPFVQEAKRLGLRSRAAFKLMEIDARFGLLQGGGRIVDLGAAPGSWTQVAVDRSGAAAGKGRVVAVDIHPVEPIAGATVIEADIRDGEVAGTARAALGGLADVVLSDMAAPVTGHRRTDHLRTMALGEAALAFASEVLAPGGSLVLKAFAGGAHGELMQAVNGAFGKVRTVKPDASRAESPETYVVATGFRGGGEP